MPGSVSSPSDKWTHLNSQECYQVGTTINPFYRWENWGSGRVRTSSKPARGHAGVGTNAAWLSARVLYHCVTPPQQDRQRLGAGFLRSCRKGWSGYRLHFANRGVSPGPVATRVPPWAWGGRSHSEFKNRTCLGSTELKREEEAKWG